MPQSLYLLSAPQDDAWLDQALRHLTVLQNAQVLQVWSRRNLTAGEDIRLAQSEALSTADIIVLLLSPHFLSDPNIYPQEVQRALQRQARGQARIVPVLLRECLWQYTTLASLTLLPSNGQAISSDAWDNADEAWVGIIQQIAELAQNPLPTTATTSPTTDEYFTDPRDGQVYPLCQFVGKTWMSVNLNFADEVDYQTYNADFEVAKTHGGLYTWEAAKEACPPGWRVATDADWQELIAFYGNDYLAYKHLRVGGDSPLQMSFGGKWSMHSHQFVLLNECGFYWSAAEANYEQGIYYMFDDGMAALRRIAVDKKTGASVRCVRID